jgi:hypothetical protein
VRIDYDHAASFSKYRTFMWAKEPEPDDPFMKQRIINAVNLQLKAKGLESSTQADLAIVANTSTQEIQTVNTYYSGGSWGGGWATTTVDTNRRHF